MSFPTVYKELLLPKLLIYTLTLVNFIRKFISTIFRLFGLGGSELSDPTRPGCVNEFTCVSAALMRELLPVVKYAELVEPRPESCAVCLYEFEGGDEIRRLTNCRHIFHRNCVDRWMDHDQNTCPLCRTPFVPDELREEFNERLWGASGIGDYYCEHEYFASSY